jgi:hypothetical protein
MDENYLHDNELADLLGIELRTLRNKICEGHPLPPHIEPKGMRVRLWPRRELEKWLLQFTRGTKNGGNEQTGLVTSGTTGRPRKAPWGGKK